MPWSAQLIVEFLGLSNPAKITHNFYGFIQKNVSVHLQYFCTTQRDPLKPTLRVPEVPCLQGWFLADGFLYDFRLYVPFFAVKWGYHHVLAQFLFHELRSRRFFARAKYFREMLTYHSRYRQELCDSTQRDLKRLHCTLDEELSGIHNCSCGHAPNVSFYRFQCSVTLGTTPNNHVNDVTHCNYDDSAAERATLKNGQDYRTSSSRKIHDVRFY